MGLFKEFEVIGFKWFVKKYINNGCKRVMNNRRYIFCLFVLVILFGVDFGIMINFRVCICKCMRKEMSLSK